MSSLAPLLERLLPEAVDRFLEEVLGKTMPRLGEGNRWKISSCGSFSGRIAADLLAFAKNHEMNAAMVMVEAEVARVIYFEKGMVVGSRSNVIFERLGRVLLRQGELSPEVAEQVVEMEGFAGMVVASGLVPPEALLPALEQRTWEIATNLPLMHNAHFLIVDGVPDLGSLPRLAIPPMDLAIEGLRRYDEWRNGAAGVPIPARKAPETRPPEAPAAVRKPPVKSAASAADEILRQLRDEV